MLHCQPPVPSRETASPVDLEGTERTKDGGVASTRVREELGSADSAFKGTETFEGTRAENFYCGDTVAWLPRWVTSKMRSRRKPSEARGRSSTERVTRSGATRPSRVREEQSAGLRGHFQFSAPVRAKPGFPLPAPAPPPPCPLAVAGGCSSQQTPPSAGPNPSLPLSLASQKS